MTAVGVGAGQLFEVVGVLNGGGDLVVSAGPFAQVEDAATVGAEGEVLVGGEDYFAAGGAEESFRHGGTDLDCNFFGRGSGDGAEAWLPEMAVALRPP